MRSNMLITIAVVALLLVMAAPRVAGQIAYGQPASVDVGFVMTHYQAETADAGDEATVDQMYFPVFAFAPIRDNFDISVFGASATNTVEFTDTEYDLNGMSDILVQANHSFLQDRLLLSAGVSIPSGKKEVSRSDEYPVLEALATDYLDMPLRRLGEGFGFNVLVGGATVLSEMMRGGAAIRYQYAGEYSPYDVESDYDPGDIISGSVGVDFEDGALLWAASLAYTTYMTDKLDGAEIFGQSPTLDVSTRGTWKAEQVAFTVHLAYVSRGENKPYDSTGAELTAVKLYGNEFVIGGEAAWSPTDGWTVTPSVVLHSIAGANDARESASVLAFGGDIARRFSKQFGLRAGGKFLTGSADGGDTDLSGYQITAGLSLSM